MPKIMFSGASDDLAHVSGPVVAYDSDDKIVDGDEFGCYDTDPVFHILSEDHEPAMRVTLQYGKETPCWEIAVGMMNEGKPLPGWPIYYTNCDTCDYSVQLVVEAPEGYYAKRVK